MKMDWRYQIATSTRYMVDNYCFCWHELELQMDWRYQIAKAAWLIKVQSWKVENGLNMFPYEYRITPFAGSIHFLDGSPGLHYETGHSNREEKV